MRITHFLSLYATATILVAQAKPHIGFRFRRDVPAAYHADKEICQKLGENCNTQKSCCTGLNCKSGKCCDSASESGDNPIPTGQTCKKNDICAEGKCCNGVCTEYQNCKNDSPPIATGEPCTKKDVCEAGKCCNDVCTTNQKCDSTTIPTGEPCEKGDTCATGKCCNGICTTKKKCDKPIPTGEACEENDICEAGKCCSGICTNRETCTIPTGQACQDGIACEEGVCCKDVCTALPTCILETDDPCKEGDVCREGQCCNNVCTTRQTCTIPTGETCTANDVCAEGLCCDEICTQIGGECPDKCATGAEIIKNGGFEEPGFVTGTIPKWSYGASHESTIFEPSPLTYEGTCVTFNVPYNYLGHLDQPLQVCKGRRYHFSFRVQMGAPVGTNTDIVIGAAYFTINFANVGSPCYGRTYNEVTDLRYTTCEVDYDNIDDENIHMRIYFMAYTSFPLDIQFYVDSVSVTVAGPL